MDEELDGTPRPRGSFGLFALGLCWMCSGLLTGCPSRDASSSPPPTKESASRKVSAELHDPSETPGSDPQASEAVATEARQTESFARYWTAFRARMLGDADEPPWSDLVQFPFIVRWGNADENDPRIELDEAAFVKGLPRIMQLSAAGERTVKRFLLETPNGSVLNRDDEDAIYVEPLEFARIEGRWLATAAYGDGLEAFSRDEAPYTPSQSSPERTAVLDAIRDELGTRQKLVVRHLVVHERWAYFEGAGASGTPTVIKALLRQGVHDLTWMVQLSSTVEADPGFDAKLARYREDYLLTPTLFPNQKATRP